MTNYLYVRITFSSMKWINEPCVGARLRRIVCFNRISTLLFFYIFLLMKVNALFNEFKLSFYITEKSTVHYWIYIQLLFHYILCFNVCTTMSFNLFIQFVHIQLFTMYYLFIGQKSIGQYYCICNLRSQPLLLLWKLFQDDYIMNVG